MPKKKQTRNGFYWFMQDIMPDLQREGRVFPNGMSDVVPVAQPRWKALPQSERDRYEAIAKEQKKKQQRDDANRRDNQGNIIKHRQDPMEVMRLEKIKENKISRSRWPANPDELIHHQFYFMHIEYLCKTEDGEYLPCEIGMVEFTLADGITNTFHKFIEPGGIPLGYRHTCQAHSEDTHKIPIESFDQADSNYRGIYIQLENFINKDGSKHEYPPVYVMESNIECARYTVDWIHIKACLGLNHPLRIKNIFYLENMIAQIYAVKEKPVSEAAAKTIINRTTYDYEPNSRCTWHEEADTKDCALYNVRRTCYTVSESLADLYDFQLGGGHRPEPAKVAYRKLPSGAFDCFGSKPLMINDPSTQLQNRKFTTTANRDARLKEMEATIKNDLDDLDFDDDEENNDDDNVGDDGQPFTIVSYENLGLSTEMKRPKIADDWPSLSNEPGAVKYAGRAGPPPPGSAPMPPSSWQTVGGSPSQNTWSGKAGMPFQNQNLPIATNTASQGYVVKAKTEDAPSKPTLAQTVRGTDEQQQQPITGQGRGWSKRGGARRAPGAWGTSQPKPEFNMTKKKKVPTATLR